MLFAKLAWRNILRNRRRTALTVIAIVIGVAALVFAWALFDGSNRQSINNMTGTFTGHVQIHRRGYTDDPSLERILAPADIDVARLAQVRGVEAVSTRLDSPVLISTDENSRGVLLVGVDPVAEPSVTSLQHKLALGSYFAPGDHGGLLIGASLARALKVGLGDEVAVLTQGLYGSIGAARYRVTGIYDTGNEMVDGMQAFVTLADADELLSAGGQRTTVSLRLSGHEISPAVVSELATLLPADVEVEGWEKLLPDVAQKVSFHEWIATVIMIILFAIVMIGVTNTILMSVFERRREFGVMMAMGTTGAQLFRTILYEGALIGLIGFTLGLAIGGGFVAHYSVNGIDFTSQSQAVQSMRGVANKLYPHLSLNRTLFIGLAVVFVSVGAAVYPAAKTAGMLPLDALRGGIGFRAVGIVRSSQRFLLGALALRNVGRYPVRTLLTGFGIMFAMGTFVFLGCFVEGYYRQIVENSTGFITGDGQVQNARYKAELKPSLMLAEGAPMLDRLRASPDIRSASPRVQTPAMLSSPAGAEPILLLGVEPTAEREVTFLYKSVKDGGYLDPGHDHELVIGQKLAARLKVRVGEKLVVMAQDVHGELISESFIVAGLFNTGSHGFDDSMGHVSLPALQRVLGMDGHYTSIAFRVRDQTRLDAVIASLAPVVNDPDAHVYSWQELLPEVVQMNAIFKGSLVLVMGIVSLTIAVVIMNTVLMSVLERTREFGTMLALGSPPGMIVRLVLIESGIVGVAGSLVGLGFGTLAAYAHSLTGMSMKSHGMTAIPGTTDVVFPQVTLAATLEPAVLLPLVILLVSLYPALRAARLEPVQALRHV